MLDNKWELEDWINKFPSTREILKGPFQTIKSAWVNYNCLACKFYWPRELRNHAQLVFFFCGHKHFPQISTNSFVVVVGSWELQNQHPTQWEFKTGFVKHPRMVIILSLFLFHTHMLSLLHGKPPTLALKDHDLRYHTCNWCVILNHSQKVCWKNRKEFGGICQNLWEL